MALLISRMWLGYLELSIEAWKDAIMHQARKLKMVAAAGHVQPVAGRFAEGHVVALGSAGRATFRDQDGAELEVRVPRQADRRWLKSAVALAPVPAMVLVLEDGSSPVLSYVFAAPEHEGLDEHVRLDGKTIELAAQESIRIRTGRSIVTVTAEGEVNVRGRNITSRASNVNRVRGGVVKIN
jgi:hypothetical protein